MIKHSYFILLLAAFLGSGCSDGNSSRARRAFNAPYQGEYLNRIAFPIGGIGTGMLCIEGTGAISHVSLRHHPELFHEPCMFAAIHVKGLENGAKILERTIPDWKKFGMRESSLGNGGTTWGLPRFMEGTFSVRFPFAEIKLKDAGMPLDVTLKAWNPFIPTDEDNSGLPVGAIEYTFRNTGAEVVEAVFSYNSRNFMYVHGKGSSSVEPLEHGFILSQTGTENEPFHQGEFAAFTDDPQTKTDRLWFRGGWFDPLTIRWNEVAAGIIKENNFEPGAPGGSLFVPFELGPEEEKTITLYMAWYVPYSNLRIGPEPVSKEDLPSYNPDAGKSDEVYKS